MKVIPASHGDAWMRPFGRFEISTARWLRWMPTSLWRVKGRAYLTVGVLLLLLFAVGVIIGVSYLYGYPYYAPGNFPVITGVCIPTALVPGLVLIVLGRRAALKEKELIEFTAWVKTYRRISLADLARKLGKPQMEAEQLLVTVVDRGLLKGFIDRSTDEFVLQDAVGQEAFLDTCPRCGANLQKRYFLGETVTCPYCQTVIASKAPKRLGPS